MDREKHVPEIPPCDERRIIRDDAPKRAIDRNHHEVDETVWWTHGNGHCLEVVGVDRTGRADKAESTVPRVNFDGLLLDQIMNFHRRERALTCGKVGAYDKPQCVCLSNGCRGGDQRGSNKAHGFFHFFYRANVSDEAAVSRRLRRCVGGSFALKHLGISQVFCPARCALIDDEVSNRRDVDFEPLNLDNRGVGKGVGKR